MERLRRAWRYTRAHPLRVGLSFGALAFVVLNALAARHAWAMTHFVAGGERTPGPEALTLKGKLEALAFGVRVRRPVNTRSPSALGLPFETVRFAARDGVALEAWSVVHPKPRGTVVLCHGYAASKASQLDAAKILFDLGWSSLLLDLRGSGGSDGDVTSLGWHEALDVEAAVAWSRVHSAGRPVVLLGASLGAAAATRAVAVGGVRPDALILESPFDRLLRTVERRFDALGVPAFPAAHLLLLWGGALGGLGPGGGFEHDPVAYAPKIDCATLVLHGDQDARVSLAEARAVADALPRGSLHVFEGLGHVTFARTRPQAWRAVVGPFLTAVRAGDRSAR